MRKTGFDFLQQIYILRVIGWVPLKMWSTERVKQCCKNIPWVNSRREKELPKESHVIDIVTKGHKLDCNVIRLQIRRNPWPGVPWWWGRSPRLHWDKQPTRCKVSSVPQRGCLPDRPQPRELGLTCQSISPRPVPTSSPLPSFPSSVVQPAPTAPGWCLWSTRATDRLPFYGKTWESP